MLDDDLEKKLRFKQERLIQKGKGTISFSQVLNQVLRDGLKTKREMELADVI